MLAFCSRERPFRELVLSSLSEDSRREIAKELYARFRQADERQFRYLLRSGFQTAPDGFQRFNAFLHALAGSRRALVVDLSKVSFLASMGIRLLVIGAKTVASKGGKIVLLDPDPNIESVLTTAGIDSVIPIHHDRASAVAAVTL